MLQLVSMITRTIEGQLTSEPDRLFKKLISKKVVAL